MEQTIIQAKDTVAVISNPSFELYFETGREPHLSYTSFRYGLLPGGKVISVRGEKLGAFNFQSTYRWSRAVKVLSVFFLREKAQKYDDPPFYSEAKVVFRGDLGTFATSLAATIDKQPVWLFEMFGHSFSGRPFSRKAFRIKNPQRRTGPEVLVSLNDQFLAPDRITIFVNGEIVIDRKRLLGLAEAIEESFRE